MTESTIVESSMGGGDKKETTVPRGQFEYQKKKMPPIERTKTNRANDLDAKSKICIFIEWRFLIYSLLG